MTCTIYNWIKIMLISLHCNCSVHNFYFRTYLQQQFRYHKIPSTNRRNLVTGTFYLGFLRCKSKNFVCSSLLSLSSIIHKTHFHCFCTNTNKEQQHEGHYVGLQRRCKWIIFCIPYLVDYLLFLSVFLCSFMWNPALSHAVHDTSNVKCISKMQRIREGNARTCTCTGGRSKNKL